MSRHFLMMNIAQNNGATLSGQLFPRRGAYL